MKTLDEVIKAYECCNYDDGCEDCPYNGITCTLERNTDVLHYLKEYRDTCKHLEDLEIEYVHLRDEASKMFDKQMEELRLNNPALTWEELKQMEGKPVWVEGAEMKCWELIDTIDNSVMIGRDRGGYSDYFYRINQETQWNAFKKEN